jgi:hypothetical protein
MHKLLTPQVARLGRPDVPPETDAVDPSFSDGTPELLRRISSISWGKVRC